MEYASWRQIEFHWAQLAYDYAALVRKLAWRCFCFLSSGFVFTSVVVVRLLAGGRPATTYLFCFAKKGMPKKAPQSRCPCGMPNCAGRKMGNEANSLPLQGAYPLASGYRYAGVVHAPRNPCYTSNTNLSDPFSASHNWQVQQGIRVAPLRACVTKLPCKAIFLPFRDTGGTCEFDSKANSKANSSRMSVPVLSWR
jgi:hypothetical protein